MASVETGKHKLNLQFHYVKNTGYREIPCHGAVGGTTPQRKIWMAFFSERRPLPRVVEFEIETPDETGTVAFNEATAAPSRIESRSGIVRQVEFGAYLDLDIARQVHTWLGARIAELEAVGKE